MTVTSAIRVTLNGELREATVENDVLLAEFVRDQGALGTRLGCRTGDCGACTIFVDDLVTKSCLLLAAQANGCNIQTIEGCVDAITQRLQSAFIKHNGFQCGFCTSGMILTAVSLLRVNPRPTYAEIVEAISGNLCRCTGYNAIADAIADAASDHHQQQETAGGKNR